MIRLLKLAACALAIAAPAARADVVSDWYELQTSLAKASQDPAAPFDPASFEAEAKTALAMFEAANSVDPRYESWLKVPRAPPDASQTAAVAVAAHDVLAKLYPGQAEKIGRALTLALIEVPPGPARNQGTAAGHAAATAALAAGGIDPALPRGTYRPTAPAGRWSASGIPFPPEIVSFRPWFMSSAAQFRLPPPPPLTDPAYTASFNETKAVGALKSTVRTPEQTLNAKFFVDYELDPMLRQVAAMPGRSVVRNARFYALIAMAGEDDYIVMADGKMAHMFWRPLNAIRTADADDNPATEADPDWEPLVRTPAQPEYPCGHCSYSQLIATIVSAEGPPPPGGYRFVSANLEGLSRSFPTIQAYADAVSDSRIKAGVHWRLTAEATRAKSVALARMAMDKFAPKVK